MATDHYYDVTAREYLADLAKDGTKLYVERIWAMRYPLPSPKPSAGWPYRSVGEKSENRRKKRDTTRV
jgi:hypothetical protein